MLSITRKFSCQTIACKAIATNNKKLKPYILDILQWMLNELKHTHIDKEDQPSKSSQVESAKSTTDIGEESFCDQCKQPIGNCFYFKEEKKLCCGRVVLEWSSEITTKDINNYLEN